MSQSSDTTVGACVVCADSMENGGSAKATGTSPPSGAIIVEGAPPFGHLAPNTNPYFVPCRMSSLTASVTKLKAPKPPEKPLMPYMRYSRKVWDGVKYGNKDCKLWEIGKIIGQMWRDLANSDKQIFVDEYEMEKKEYSEALKQYQNSSVYQQYLIAKEKLQSSEPKRAVSSSTGCAGGSLMETTGSEIGGAKVKQSKESRNDTKLGIPPVDSESAESYGDQWLRRVATWRFQLNQRLLHELFNDTVVPDARAIVTATRLTTLKRQVGSLTSHQLRLEEEIDQLQVEFEAKKRRLKTANDQFSNQIKELCEPAVDADAYAALVGKATDKLLGDYRLYRRRQQPTSSPPPPVAPPSTADAGDTDSPPAVVPPTSEDGVAEQSPAAQQATTDSSTAVVQGSDVTDGSAPSVACDTTADGNGGDETVVTVKAQQPPPSPTPTADTKAVDADGCAE